MATLEEAIEKGHKRYFKNSYWKGLYEDAPEDAKMYYDLILSQLDGGNDKENDEAFRSHLEDAYKSMGDYGWEYLIHNATSPMEKAHLKDKRKRFSKKE